MWSILLPFGMIGIEETCQHGEGFAWARIYSFKMMDHG